MARLIAAGLTATAAFFSLWLKPPGPRLMHWTIWELAVGLGFAVAAYAVCSTRPRSAPGRLMFLVSWLLFAAATAAVWLGRDVSNSLWMLAIGVVGLALLRVVNDRPAPRIMRAADALVTLAALALSGAVLFDAVPVAALAAVGGGVVLLVAGWVQFELTAGDARRRVLWAILGVCLMVPLTFLVMVVNDHLMSQFARTASTVGLIAVALALPAAIALASTDPRLIDVRAVIRQVSVMIIMLCLTLAVYIGGKAAVLAIAGEPAGDWVEVPLIALIAVGFHPAMARVRASVDELLFGGRADPVATLSRLGDQLTAGSTPVQWLETLRAALAVPGITLMQGTQAVATAGQAGGTEVTPLRIGGEHLGDLVITLPPDQPVLAPASKSVLALIAGPVAQALHATRLSEQLRISRSRLVTALEEERRRTRRDLHDGLGPTLTGIAYSADAAANLARTEPDRVLEILRQLRADTGEAIAEVRRIVYGLRPKALDELGLVGAVKQRVSNLPLRINLTTPPHLPELPAAVEVAAYRVAVEALTNVARHAGVGEADLVITIDARALGVVVRDEGRPEPGWEPGVGVASMRERVEQIGGTFTVVSGQTGTVVTADLPLSDSLKNG